MKLNHDAILMAPTCCKLSIDDDRRVLIVGDLDGDFVQLQKALDEIKYNSSIDQLISLGDVIDRGKDSIRLLNFFTESSAKMVLGNHEQLMIESVINSDKKAEKLWSMNGGGWHKNIPRQKLESLCHYLLQQPLSIMLQYRSHKIGLSHTLPIKWGWQNFPDSKSDIVHGFLWDRERVTKGKCHGNIGVDISIHGHNSIQVPLWIANSYHIDTGFYGRPTIVELGEVIKRIP